MLNPVLKLIIQIFIILITAPLVSGIIRKIKARTQHRVGAPVLQLYFDIIKLFKKEVVVSENASWIFRATPYIYFTSMLIAAICIPAVPQLFSFNFMSDAILAVYLFAIGRFFMTLSSLDTGSTFGGMGASRELMISSLIEPSLIVTIFTIGLSNLVKSTGLKAIYEGSLNAHFGLFSPVYVLLFASMILILLAETARIPVDDPATHLELTMVHEAMILEYSGRHLALMHLAAAMKQLLLITLIINIFIPFGASLELGIGLVISLCLYIVKVAAVAVLIGLIEINTVKLRLFSVPNIAAISFILAVLGFMSSMVLGR